jgi:hypothetical protein
MLRRRGAGATGDPSGSALVGRGVVLATVLLVAVVCLPRLVPRSQSDDHGTFVSVAERLLAGDRLYVDVWDNKDPVFYWVMALGRLVSPVADVAVEIAWMLLACVATWLLARSRGLGRTLSLLVSGLALLVLTGSAYIAGMTHLPGIALALAAIAPAWRRHWVVAGIIVGLVVLTKVTLAPVAAAGVLVCLWHCRSLPGLFRTAAGGVGALLAGAALLWGRGELTGWLASYRDNFAYSTGELSLSRYGGAAGHLLRAFPEATSSAALVTLVTLVVVLVALPRPAKARRSAAPPGGQSVPNAEMASAVGLVWTTVCVTLVVDLVVLALTATWPYHGGSLGVPAVLALVHVAGWLQASSAGTSGWRVPRATGLRATALLVLAAFCLGGALHPAYFVQSARSLPSALDDLRAVPTSTNEILDQPNVHTYARAGSNDLTGHAVGLRGLDLLCPRFHQYSFQSAEVLEDLAGCLGRADALIVADNLVPDASRPAWDAFVRQVQLLVSTGYTCRPATGGRVCVKNEVYVPPPGSAAS